MSSKLLYDKVIYCIVFVVVELSLIPTYGQQGRVTTNFDKNWKFYLGDIVGAEKLSFDDNSWRTLNVPHDWSIEGNYDSNNPTQRGGGYLPAGVGWYRKCFTMSNSDTEHSVFIEFDAVMANSDIWINGHYLGHRPMGYLPINYEITKYLKFNEVNVIAVRVDNSIQPASRWYTGAGIYRHVKLITTNPIHLERGSVFITTPKIEKNSAEVRISCSIINSSQNTCKIGFQTEIKSPSGQKIQSDYEMVTILAGDTIHSLQTVIISHPVIWDIQTPNLYCATTRIFNEKHLIDYELNKFGIRNFKFESKTGFWLNGHNLKILGACVHHDGGAVGTAVPASVWARRIQRLKQIGCNALRGAHTPMDQTFYNLCDSLGMLLLDETFDTWTAAKPNGEKAYNLYFKDWWKIDAKEAIIRIRNHPSIILYSLGNEIRDNLNSLEGRRYFLDLRSLTRKLDPTRPITMALFRPKQMRLFENGFSEMLNVIGQNYGEKGLIAVGAAKPGRKIIGTENTPSRSSWLVVRDTPAMAGMFIWTGFDYLGESDWPRIAWNTGLFDRNGNWKHLSWERQSWWTDKPMVHIVRRSKDLQNGYTDDWTPASPDSYRAEVIVYSNCDEVELLLNGKSLGIQSVPHDDSPNIWHIDYQPGVLKAIGRINGNEVANHEHRTAGEAHHIILETERTVLPYDWEDVAYLTATVVDMHGVRCPNILTDIKFNISGPGEIISIDNSDVFSHERYKANHRTAYKGRVIAIVRAIADNGTITVKAEADGLGSSNVTIKATR